MTLDRETQKLVLFFGSLALFAAVLAIGTNLLLKSLPQDGASEVTLPPVKTEGERPPESDGARTKVIAPGTVDPRAIRYTETGFEPVLVTIRASDPIGCLISVINRSQRPIRLGVNPHAETGDPGANYGELAPAETGIYDVRYAGFVEILLHNHSAPSHELKVMYGASCQ